MSGLLEVGTSETHTVLLIPREAVIAVAILASLIVFDDAHAEDGSSLGEPDAAAAHRVRHAVAAGEAGRVRFVLDGALAVAVEADLQSSLAEAPGALDVVRRGADWRALHNVVARSVAFDLFALLCQLR